MIIVEESIIIKNERLVLTNQRAIYWERKEALILSDLHIGKTAHFRKHGIPMPDEILQNDLERLKLLITHFKIKQLLIVGDLFHAEANSDIETFNIWLKQFKSLDITLIKGNHDRISESLKSKFKFNIVHKKIILPFSFLHDVLDCSNENFTISGHTHPGILIKGKGKQWLKLPCYQITKAQLVLPAFSLFTGLNTKSKPNGAVCYAFTENSIFKF